MVSDTGDALEIFTEYLRDSTQFFPINHIPVTKFRYTVGYLKGAAWALLSLRLTVMNFVTYPCLTLISIHTLMTLPFQFTERPGLKLESEEAISLVISWLVHHLLTLNIEIPDLCDHPSSQPTEKSIKEKDHTCPSNSFTCSCPSLRTSSPKYLSVTLYHC